MLQGPFGFGVLPICFESPDVQNLQLLLTRLDFPLISKSISSPLKTKSRSDRIPLPLFPITMSADWAVYENRTRISQPWHHLLSFFG